MPVQFDAQNIFGAVTQQVGLSPRHRWQDEYIPGLPGNRIYNLGPEGNVWSIRGRMTSVGVSYAAARNTLVDTMLSASTYLNGGLYTFTDAGGNAFDNCQLIEWRQAGPLQACDLDGVPACSVIITATVRWVLPT